MKDKKIAEELNILKQCEDYGVPLTKCPQFLFLAMGVVIIATMLATNFFGDIFFDDPVLVLLIIIGETVILFIVGYAVIGGFEKMAEANKMKSDFIDLVTHQLRSPLTNLKWGFQDLQEEEKGKNEELLNTLQSNVDKMSEMVDNLLIVSKMEQEGFDFEKDSFSIKDVVEELLNEYGTAEKEGVNLIYKPGDVPEVISDPSQLKIVMDNFISNAIKYTKEGGEVKIRLKRKDNFVVFEVEDEGIGIPEADRKKVFSKFERAGNVEKVKKSGSGLGLFLSKEIIENLGGEIGFESVEDEGSTFWFKIPVAI